MQRGVEIGQWLRIYQSQYCFFLDLLKSMCA